MTHIELLKAVSEREQQGLRTCRVTMSQADADELRASLVPKRPWWRRVLKRGTGLPGIEGKFGTVYNIDIWVYEDQEPLFEGPAA